MPEWSRSTDSWSSFSPSRSTLRFLVPEWRSVVSVLIGVQIPGARVEECGFSPGIGVQIPGARVE